VPGNPEPLEDGAEGARPRSRRRLLVGVVAVVCVIGLAVALVAVRRGGGDGTTTAAPPVTFGPEGDATTIPEPPPNFDPIMQASLDSAPAGTEITLQGAGFKAGKGFRRVELYWDKPGGQRLATVDGPRFSVKLKIPADAPVINEGHNIVAVQRASGGKVASQTSVPFFVVPARR
jgi:hypothetical protein